MIRTLLLSFLLLGVTVAHAQRLNENPDYAELLKGPYHRWIVKMAPMALFDPDNTVQFGAEHLLSRRNAVQVELGYGWPGFNLWRNSQNTSYSNREIWRGRAEWRHYFSAGPIGRYFALEGFYKQVNALDNSSVGIGCQSGPCQYYQLVSGTVQKYVWGAHAKLGRQFAFTADERLLGDFYVGLGFRKRYVTRHGLPDVGNTTVFRSNDALFDPFSNVSYATLSVAFGLKVGYAL